MNLWQYLDYREYLLDFYEEKKAEHRYFSYRYMGAKLQVDAGYLVKILQKKHHLADGKISKAIQLCGLQNKEAEFFEALVRFGKAKTEKEVRMYFDKLVSLKQVKSKKIKKEQYTYYQKWYYTAVRALLSCKPDQKDLKEMGKMLEPALSAKEIRESLDTLKSLNLIEADRDGDYRPKDFHVSTGSDYTSVAVKNYQSDLMDLAKNSLRNHAKKVRDISSLTVSLDDEAFEDIKILSNQFYDDIKKRVSEVKGSNQVYQVNIQLFPLSKKVKA